MLRILTSLVFCLLLASFSAQAQSTSDLLKIATHIPASALPDHSYEKHEKKKLSVINAINPLYWTYKGGLAFYQKHISAQLSSTCIYETSCSRFGKKLFDEYGPIKGVFLSVDRIGRCNRLTHSQALPTSMNDQGKIIESIEDYSNKH
ncbi:membrane protein insertion efficiency factor YidD [Fulvivirga lutea]|uniref:Membrane protein insertion efficiency factor YidD n=1 Tax=Fulvivirga lutea TaxID=2810512 RepID=A0A974ZZF1_9BACT|nr:membrane protein insertion efficiency factor YidD [Fulvivirga lutea]QSE95995.1 membrane protein insertion efficiency factor YidD [Fulvivirga lutea]